MSLIGFGNSQLCFRVCGGTFPGSATPHLYREGDLFCLVFGVESYLGQGREGCVTMASGGRRESGLLF